MGMTMQAGSMTGDAKVIDSAVWKNILAKYQRPSVARAMWQLGGTLALLSVALWVMYLSLDYTYWLTLALAFPTAGLIVRTFCIMHDCSHGSFLPSRQANDAIGYITGVLTLTPFAQWRRDHALHHASSGDLDRRGHGDVNTLTVKEYLALSKTGRLKYRLFRHPMLMLGFGPIWLAVNQRFRGKSTATGSKQLWSVWTTNIGILALLTLFSLLVGVKATVMIYGPAFYIAGIAGVWLFYVQHQFEDAYWEQHGDWDYATAAIKGSSHFRLPGILQWFTANIGLHHVHHLGPRIPNYNLKRCHEENPSFHVAPVLTLKQSLKTFGLTLWDEDRKRLIGFKDLPANAA